MYAFNFADEYILEDEHTLLRPLVPTDFNNLLRFSVEQPELWRYSTQQAIGAEGLTNYINQTLKAREEHREYPFIVFDKRSGAYAGSTRFYDIQPENGTLQLGFTWYGKEFQGTGLNKRCKFLLLRFAFETMQMHRVEFRADNRNERSKAAMMSIGCTVEGVLRQTKTARDGSRMDVIILSILKDEWENGIKNKLETRIKELL